MVALKGARKITSRVQKKGVINKQEDRAANQIKLPPLSVSAFLQVFLIGVLADFYRVFRDVY